MCRGTSYPFGAVLACQGCGCTICGARASRSLLDLGESFRRRLGCRGKRLDEVEVRNRRLNSKGEHQVVACCQRMGLGGKHVRRPLCWRWHPACIDSVGLAPTEAGTFVHVQRSRHPTVKGRPSWFR